MTMQDNIDNVTSVVAGICSAFYGAYKGLTILPSASESFNTFLLAMIGGAGGYIAKEITKRIIDRARKRKQK
jgi:hypothetical protein